MRYFYEIDYPHINTPPTLDGFFTLPFFEEEHFGTDPLGSYSPAPVLAPLAKYNVP